MLITLKNGVEWTVTNMDLNTLSSENELYNVLETNGATVVDKQGFTPLSVAVRNGWKDLALELIAKNTDYSPIRFSDKDDRDPEYWEKEDCILVYSGDSAGEEMDRDPLCLALETGQFDIADILIGNTDYINKEFGYECHTILTMMLQWMEESKIPLVKYLISNGAKTRVMTHDADTPMFILQRQYGGEELLLKVGAMLTYNCTEPTTEQIAAVQSVWENSADLDLYGFAVEDSTEFLADEFELDLPEMSEENRIEVLKRIESYAWNESAETFASVVGSILKDLGIKTA